MKILDGSELAGFIKERQAKQVRALRQAHGVAPKLAIVVSQSLPVIDTYVRLKERYGEDILVGVDVIRPDPSLLAETITSLNEDTAVHGIVVQLPLADASQTDEIVNLVASQKDVDGLGEHAELDQATPTAISWLLAGYGVELKNRKLVIVGAGRLVGAPLAKMWQSSGLEPIIVGEPSDTLRDTLKDADIIVSGAGVPGLITSDMVRPGVVLVDAGTADEGGKIVGDVAADVRERHDITMTPEKGGVGPLTVCALFDNVIRAARATIQD